MIDRGLLDILICPVCKGSVEQRNDRICCLECGRRYPIRDGVIPVMLADEAELPDAQHTAAGPAEPED